jgi:hypothetical protein
MYPRRYSFLGCLAFFVAAIAGTSAQAGSPFYTLDFQKNHDLKVVYNAGLRPWKVTNSTCMVGGDGMKDITNWEIILPNGQSFRYSSNMASFEIMEDDSIGRIDFGGVDDTPISDATMMTKAICASLNIPTDGLDAMVGGLDPKAKFEGHFNPEQGWGRRLAVAGLDFDLMYVVRPFFDHTSAQVNITMEWPNLAPAPNPTMRPLKKLISDLQPPPGYEGVSMQSPRSHVQPGVPAHDANYYKQKIADAMNQQMEKENITPAEKAPTPVYTIPLIQGADYVAGQDYTYDLPHKTASWTNYTGDYLGFDAKVRHLLQADKDIKNLYKENVRLLKASSTMRASIFLAPSLPSLLKTIDNLDFVLVQTYDQATPIFQAHQNVLLLKEMLCHYYLYVDSQNAAWPSIIDKLRQIDPGTDAEAQKEVKALRAANPGLEPGFKL